jgi:hypothetical protein
LQRPPVFGWSAVETRVALTYAGVWVIALAAWQAGRPDLIRSPRLVLAHVWEGVELWNALFFLCDGFFQAGRFRYALRCVVHDAPRSSCFVMMMQAGADRPAALE